MLARYLLAAVLRPTHVAAFMREPSQRRWGAASDRCFIGASVNSMTTTGIQTITATRTGLIGVPRRHWRCSHPFGIPSFTARRPCSQFGLGRLQPCAWSGACVPELSPRWVSIRERVAAIVDSKAIEGSRFPSITFPKFAASTPNIFANAVNQYPRASPSATLPRASVHRDAFLVGSRHALPHPPSA